MLLAWGDYIFPASACGVSNTTRAHFAKWSGLPLYYDTRFHVHAFLGTTQQGTAAQIQLSQFETILRAALAIPYQNFVLYCDNGTASSLSLLTADTMTGLRCENVETREVTNGEFATIRTVDFDIVASYAILNTANALVSYKESCEIIGNGGPLRKWRFPINNSVGIRQIISPYSLITMRQSGEAIGFAKRPIATPPQFPLYLVNEAEREKVDTPEFQGNTLTDYGVQWSYTFERGDGGVLTAIPIIPAAYL